MPRRSRLVLANVPLHLIQRGNNRQACFFADADYVLYLDWLTEYADKFGGHVHAYVLMTNHVHLLVSADRAETPGLMMKALGQRYVQHINRVYRRSGSLWEGRFRSCLVQDDAYLLACQRYIELNPVRAGMVSHPVDYRWSSYHANARGKEDSLIRHHPIYAAMGLDAPSRQAAYAALFRDALDPVFVDALRRTTNGNFVLGNERFATEVATALDRRVLPGKAGRPSQAAGLRSEMPLIN
ncbi:MAG: transposase [Betaproteobacteria bacterium]|nr:MAG: transposase [Betaproteobacteria bacterium]